ITSAKMTTTANPIPVAIRSTVIAFSWGRNRYRLNMAIVWAGCTSLAGPTSQPLMCLRGGDSLHLLRTRSAPHLPARAGAHAGHAFGRADAQCAPKSRTDPG